MSEFIQFIANGERKEDETGAAITRQEHIHQIRNQVLREKNR